MIENDDDNLLTNLYKTELSNLYNELLLRPIDDEGLNYYLPLLVNKKLNLDQIRNKIINSPEFKNRYCNNPIIKEFTKLFFHHDETQLPNWGKIFWFGIQTLKVPSDLLIYQEIIYEVKPDYIIESGTYHGGSALFLANICDIMNHGKVITVDVKKRNFPKNDRISYLTGKSIDPKIINQIKNIINSKNKVMVILDSTHSKMYVDQEMEIYKEFVSEGSYLIVEDTVIDYYSLYAEFEKEGPMKSVIEFLKNNKNFVVDQDREKFLLTANINGYLKRIK